jgi:hypothetical protein
LDYYETLPFINTNPILKKKRKIKQDARLRFAKFVDEQVNPDVIKGTTEGFEVKLLELESHLRAYMQEIRRRNGTTSRH